MRFLLIFWLVLGAFGTDFVRKNNDFDISPFPAVKAGFKRHILPLAPQKNEEDYRVEIAFGKKILADCNYHFISDGELSEQILQGWGYTFFKFKSAGELASTRKMCHEKKRNKFIKSSQILRLNYNSKIPIVIYAPQDFELEISLFKKIKEVKK